MLHTKGHVKFNFIVKSKRENIIIMGKKNFKTIRLGFYLALFFALVSFPLIAPRSAKAA